MIISNDEDFDRLADKVASTFGIDSSGIFSGDIKRKYSRPRHIFFYMCMKGGMTCQTIAKKMRERGCTTLHPAVLKGREGIMMRMEEDYEYKLLINKLSSKWMNV